MANETAKLQREIFRGNARGIANAVSDVVAAQMSNPSTFPSGGGFSNYMPWALFQLDARP